MTVLLGLGLILAVMVVLGTLLAAAKEWWPYLVVICLTALLAVVAGFTGAVFSDAKPEPWVAVAGFVAVLCGTAGALGEALDREDGS